MWSELRGCLSGIYIPPTSFSTGAVRTALCFHGVCLCGWIWPCRHLADTLRGHTGGVLPSSASGQHPALARPDVRDAKWTQPPCALCTPQASMEQPSPAVGYGWIQCVLLTLCQAVCVLRLHFFCFAVKTPTAAGRTQQGIGTCQGMSLSLGDGGVLRCRLLPAQALHCAALAVLLKVLFSAELCSLQERPMSDSCHVLRDLLVSSGSFL